MKLEMMYHHLFDILLIVLFMLFVVPFSIVVGLMLISHDVRFIDPVACYFMGLGIGYITFALISMWMVFVRSRHSDIIQAMGYILKWDDGSK